MSTDLAAMVREDAKRREKERQEEVREREKESAKERRRLEPLSLESSLSVAEWLQEQGEHDAAREVKQRRLFGRMLLKLDHKGWSELKVPSAGDRAKLMYVFCCTIVLPFFSCFWMYLSPSLGVLLPACIL